MTAPRPNAADPDYELLKRDALIRDAAKALGITGDPTDPQNPAGWFEVDPDNEYVLIYHPPTGVVLDPLIPFIPWSSNFVPDPATAGVAAVWQTL